MKRAPAREILWLFLATRVALVLVTYFGFILLTQDKYASTQVGVPALLNTWDRWDALRYLRIAQYGYSVKEYTLAFSPLFPLLIALIAHPLGDWSYLLVGMLISNAALLGALLVIYQLAADMGGEQVGRRTVLYLCIFPTAFFFFAAYNESLFLFMTAATFLALRRQHWWLAGLLGFLAALTRTAGVLLIVPYLYELWLARESVRSTRRRLVLGLTPIVLIPLGTLLYCLYCWQLAGNPIAFITIQSHWARHTDWPWMGIVQAIYELVWIQPFASNNQVHILLDLSATCGFIALAILSRHRLRSSYTLWMVLLLVLMLLSPSVGQSDSLISNQRFVLEIFPAFMTLAILGIRHPRLHQVLIWAFPGLLAILSLIFVMGKWMV